MADTLSTAPAPPKPPSFGARMAAARAAKKSATPAVPPAQPDSIIPVAASTPSPAPVRSHRSASAPKTNHEGDSAIVVASLESLSPDPFTFDGVSAIMTALTRAYDRFGIARKQKREQLDAGDHVAHCETCGRRIDISKSGSFQVLTVRDEHFQPKNVFFCSANCVLGHNLKGKQRTTPGPHNQAGAVQP